MALTGSRIDHSSVIRPLVISQTPIAPAPITATVRPLRAIQFFNRVTVFSVQSGANT